MAYDGLSVKAPAIQAAPARTWPSKEWLGWAMVAVLLNACTGLKTKTDEIANPDAFNARSERLSALTQWQLAGRVSLDDGEDGGSGKLKWVVNPDSSQLDFFAAMGRGAWHLEMSDDLVTMTDAQGVHTAPDVQTLLQQQLGWPVPVEALQYWARGLYAPGPVQHSKIDSQGLLTDLQQFGWQIEFNRYDDVAEEMLPVRLEARHGQYRVKMAISSWQLVPETSR